MGPAPAVLTPMDLRVYDALVAAIRTDGRAPGYKEIAHRIGHTSVRGTGNIARAIGKLERAGKIRRGIQIVEEG